MNPLDLGILLYEGKKCGMGTVTEWNGKWKWKKDWYPNNLWTTYSSMYLAHPKPYYEETETCIIRTWNGEMEQL
jgi:hypothetical protein